MSRDSDRKSVTLNVKMFGAVYRHIARFLNWVNGTGPGSSTAQASREAAAHRRDATAHMPHGDASFGGDWGGDGDGG